MSSPNFQPRRSSRLQKKGTEHQLLWPGRSVCLSSRGWGLQGEGEASSQEALQEYARLFNRLLSLHHLAALAEAFGWVLPEEKSWKHSSSRCYSFGHHVICSSMDPSKILILNVRGLNRKARWDLVSTIIASTRPDIVFLQETKNEAISRRMEMTTLKADFDNFLVLPADGTRGGILLAWKGTVCRVITSQIDTYSISVQIESAEGSPWWFTGVYDPNLDNLKILQELHNVCAACAGPWVVGGDFKLIYRMEDKNSNNVHRAMMGCFRSFFNDLELREGEPWEENSPGRMKGKHLLWLG
jgi:hypothetical protein